MNKWVNELYFLTTSNLDLNGSVLQLTARVGTEVNSIDPTFFHYVADRELIVL